MTPFSSRYGASLAVALSSFFIAITALSWVTVDRLKYAFINARPPRPIQIVTTSLTGLDFALLGLTALCGIAILATAFRNRAAIRLCAGEHPRWLLAVTAAVLLWTAHAPLAPGLFVTGDAGTHVARIAHLAAALRTGDSLFWDNYFFGGSTLLQFTGPVFHWIGAAVTVLVGDATLAIKLTITAARACAALFAYLLARKLGVGRPAACLAALFYGGSLQLTYMEVVRSSFPQLINLAAMPAVLYATECVFQRRSVLSVPVAGLALAAIALIGSHQPTALLFALFAGVYVIARVAMDRGRLAALPALGAAAVLAGLGGLFFLAPFALERGMTADNFPTDSLVSFGLPTLETLRTFLVWGRVGQGAEYATYLGLPMLACAIAGGIVGRRPVWGLLIGLAIASLFLRGAYVRYTTFTVLFLGLAAAVGADALFRSATRRAWVPLAVFVAVILDMTPLAVQPWTRSDMGAILAAGDALEQRAVNSRVLEVWYPTGKPNVSVGPDSSPLSDRHIQMLSGPHKQDATPAHNAGAAVLRIAADDLLANGTLQPATRALLALSNIGWIVGTGPTQPGLPASYPNTISDPTLGRYLRIEEATPFVVAGRLEQADRPASFDVFPFWTWAFEPPTPDAKDAMDAVKRFFQRMGANPTTRQARTILLPTIPDGEAWRNHDGEPPMVKPLAYMVTGGRVALLVELDRPGFIRLVHPMAASVRVTRDGTPIPAAADVESLIVLPVHAGVNDIVVTAEPSRLRQTCFWITAVTAALLLLIAGWDGVRICLGRTGGCKGGGTPVSD